VANRLLEAERAVDKRAVRLLGVGVTGLLRRTQLNLDLFGSAAAGGKEAGGKSGKRGKASAPRTPAEKQDALNQTVDRLTDRFGPNAVSRARSLPADDLE
jgi:hypothetical protein